MIYLVGGAPRSGKSILGQRVAANLKIGWTSTDLLKDLLRVQDAENVPEVWKPDPQTIEASAEWFYPFLERYVWGLESSAYHYLIEGADFLPRQAAFLAEKFPLRSVFLGCLEMSFARFERYPGRSKGYSVLPESSRRHLARMVPEWSAFVREEAERYGAPYIDTGGDFSRSLLDAENILSKGAANG